MGDKDSTGHAAAPKTKQTVSDPVPLRERIAEAGRKYDGHVTNGSLEEIMKVINGNDSVQSIVDRLELIADQCLAGGHKSRSRMFKALAKSFRVRFL